MVTRNDLNEIERLRQERSTMLYLLRRYRGYNADSPKGRLAAALEHIWRILDVFVDIVERNPESWSRNEYPEETLEREMLERDAEEMTKLTKAEWLDNARTPERT